MVATAPAPAALAVMEASILVVFEFKVPPFSIITISPVAIVLVLTVLPLVIVKVVCPHPAFTANSKRNTNRYFTDLVFICFILNGLGIVNSCFIKEFFR